MREVVAYTTYSRPSLYRLLANGDFPRPIKLGANRVAFYADEIDAWIASRQRVSPIADNDGRHNPHFKDVQS
jgi:prophage regulatory protein